MLKSRLHYGSHIGTRLSIPALYDESELDGTNFKDASLSSIFPKANTSSFQHLSPNVPPLTPWKAKDVRYHLAHIFDDLQEVELPSPTRKRTEQLGKAIEVGIAENVILLDANTKLCNVNRMRRKQDKRILSKSRALSAGEAETKKKRREKKHLQSVKRRPKRLQPLKLSGGVIELGAREVAGESEF